MKATVKLANPTRGMFAAQTEDQEFVIFESTGPDEPEIGDIISHDDFHSMGGEDYRNETTKRTISVYVQNIVGNMEQARKQCFL